MRLTRTKHTTNLSTLSRSSDRHVINHVGLSLIVSVALILTACARKPVITTEFAKPLELRATCSVGRIADGLPEKFDDDDRPSFAEYEVLREAIREALVYEREFTGVGLDESTAMYEVTGSVVMFSRAEGLGGLLLGGLASEDFTVELSLLHKSTGDTVFAGKFSAVAKSFHEEGPTMYEQVAATFATELSKALRRSERASRNDK